MKKALVVVLVVVVVVTGLPILMGMSATASCRDCGPSVVVGATCAVAVLGAGMALLVALFVQHLRTRAGALRPLLHSFLIERPPRLA